MGTSQMTSEALGYGHWAYSALPTDGPTPTHISAYYSDLVGLKRKRKKEDRRLVGCVGTQEQLEGKMGGFVVDTMNLWKNTC